MPSERLDLRPVSPEVQDALWDAISVSRAAIASWLTPRYAPETRADLERFVQGWMQDARDGRAYGFSLHARDADRCVGFGLLNALHPTHRFANLGYWIRTDEVGRGYATEAVRRLAHFGIETLGLHRIELVIAPENAASLRVAETAGARCEGLLRHRIVMEGQPRDAWMWSLLPPDLRT